MATEKLRNGNSLRKDLMLVLVLLTSQLIKPFSPSLYAQTTQKSAQIKSNAHLSQQEWKVVEGYFQSPANRDLYVEFITLHDTLLGKTLWNNNVFHLLPQSPLSFVSVEEGEGGHIHIDFLKDSSGAINLMKLENAAWERAKNYKPIVRKEMEHNPDQLRAYEGVYQFKNDSTRFIQFTIEGNALVLKQHWDGNKISFVPETTLDFFSREVPFFSLTFSKNNYGRINQVIAFKKDLWIKTERPVATTDDLKLYEGKYQSIDDADNLVQLTATHNQLVIKQLWDGKEIALDRITTSYFYNDAQSFPLQILKDKDGLVNQIVILGMDRFIRIK